MRNSEIKMVRRPHNRLEGNVAGYFEVDDDSDEDADKDSSSLLNIVQGNKYSEKRRWNSTINSHFEKDEDDDDDDEGMFTEIKKVHFASKRSIVGTKGVTFERNESGTKIHDLLMKMEGRSVKERLLLWNKIPFEELLMEGKKGGMNKVLSNKMGDAGVTLLHIVCMNDPDADIVEAIVAASPDSVTRANKLGMLPIHVASQFRSSEGAIEFLAADSPTSIMQRDLSGRVPLHYAFDPSDRASPRAETNDTLGFEKRHPHAWPSPRAVIALTNPVSNGSSPSEKLPLFGDTATVTDNDGWTPLDVFAASIADVHPAGPENAGARATLNILLDARPPWTAEFRTGLLSLPSWMLREGLAHSHVKSILNAKSSTPGYTFGIMVDLLVQCVLILYFTESVGKEGIGAHPVLDAFTWTCATYLLIRDLVRVLGYLWIESFWMWASNLWNWFHLVNSVLLSCCHAKVRAGREDKEDKILIMLTGGLQWLVLLSVLRNTYLQFSIFVRGTLHVLSKLVPFIFTTVLLLGSFAFMYYTESYDNPECDNSKVNAEDKEWDENDINFCTLVGSFLKVYTMFVGGGMEDEDFQLSVTVMFLSITFAILVVILHMNVLIAVVTDAYGEVKSDGEAIYWWNRFHYIMSLDAVKDLFIHLGGERVFRKYEDKSYYWEELWDRVVWSGTYGTFGNKSHSKKAESRQTTPGNAILNVITHIGAFVFMIVWMMIGFFSFGILWPQQIRIWMFCETPPDPHCAESDRQDTAQRHARMEEMVNTSVKDMHENLAGLNKKIDDSADSLKALIGARMEEFNAKEKEIQKLLSDLVSNKSIAFR